MCRVQYHMIMCLILCNGGVDGLIGINICSTQSKFAVVCLSCIVLRYIIIIRQLICVWQYFALLFIYVYTRYSEFTNLII